jgi:hypothetical protein
MPTPYELDQAQRVLHTCELRIDGYAYAESKSTRGQDSTDWLVELRDSFTRTLAIPEDIEAAINMIADKIKMTGRDGSLFWVQAAVGIP